MKELCLRLIKDGKIVGYESITGGLRVQMHGDKPFDTPDNIAFDGFIFHDSFDIGIKVGDEWWFGNDIVKWKDSQGNTGKCKISVNNILHMNQSSRYSFYPTKRIGSIYDSEVE